MLDPKRKDIAITLTVDFLTTLSAWYFFYLLRFDLNFLGEQTGSIPPFILIPGMITSFFWISMFAIFGLYRKIYLQSRLDELIRVIQIVSLGILVLFFALFLDVLGWDLDNLSSVRKKIFFYWVIVLICVSFGRIAVRTFQKWQVRRGYGLYSALIVGTGPVAKDVLADLRRHVFSGISVKGFVSTNGVQEKVINDLPILGTVHDLHTLVEVHEIQDVIVALEIKDRDKLISILENVDRPDVTVKILPDFHQVIIGLNRTNQIFGLPLIEVMPDPMPNWEKLGKRFFDIVVSLVLLIAFLPFWLCVGLIVRLSSNGPAIYRQRRVGRFGKEFTMFKFRTMYSDAESKTGPVWAGENDPRITPLGFWLRKLRLDEIPQFINVLRGDMSLVGPRPERPFFVDKFKKEIPLYSRRLRVKPGITGWAQVKWKYDETIDDVKEKTKYDLFYLENMSLRMDFKILFNTIATVVMGKGK